MNKYRLSILDANRWTRETYNEKDCDLLRRIFEGMTRCSIVDAALIEERVGWHWVTARSYTKSVEAEENEDFEPFVCRKCGQTVTNPFESCDIEQA